MLVCRTPYRVSLFGGGSDHPRWFKEHRGKVLSFTIDKHSYLTGRELPQFYEHNYRLVYSKSEKSKNIDSIVHPAFREGIRHFGRGLRLEIHHHGELPPRSGVGSSSAFAVGLINLLEKLNGNTMSSLDLAKNAIYLEQEVLADNVGCQDQIAVSQGGLNAIAFENNEWEIEKVHLAENKLSELEDRCYLVFTGIQRTSSDVTRTLFDDFKSKTTLLKRMVEIADDAIDLFRTSESLDFVGDFLKESWALKRQSNTATSNPELDDFIDYGIMRGAKAAKILGAGGGGFVLFWLAKNQREDFLVKFDRGLHVPFKIDFSGSTFLLD
jgi:D-glycero-alpha-D-manno-heptose-7-phosphate kinase